MHQTMHDDSEYRRIELITGRRKRRTWSDEDKAEIIAASAEPGANISDVARRYGVSRGLLGIWRKDAGLIVPGMMRAQQGAGHFVPVIVEDGKAVGARGSSGKDGATTVEEAGRIEIVVNGARVVVSGAVSPALAGAIIVALRRGQ
jgi:transposase